MDANRHEQNFGTCHLKDKRLDRRAFSIGAALSQYFGQALSTVFKNAKELKRTYEFSLILK
jgi:Transposase DNA-binding